MVCPVFGKKTLEHERSENLNDIADFTYDDFKRLIS